MEAGEEEEDLEAIQAHLDMTMALTYAAVEAAYKDSTLPNDMVYETMGSFKPRPPRLGVGATPRNTSVNGTTSTTMARETARLHGRLAGKKRGRDDLNGDSIEDASATNGLKRLHINNSDSDSEEEESRATTITRKDKEKGKGKPLDKFAVRSRLKSKATKLLSETMEEVAANGSSSAGSAVNGAGKSNPFSARASLEDTRFVVPPPPKPASPSIGRPRASSTSTPGDLYSSPPQSPPRLLSPVISHSRSRSSSTSHTNSHHSSMSLSRRMMLKQQANASWRIVSVEPVVSPQQVQALAMSPLLSKPKPVEKQTGGSSGKSPTKQPATMVISPNPSMDSSAPVSPSKLKRQHQAEATGGAPVLQLEPIEPSYRQGDDALEGGVNTNDAGLKKKKKRRRRKKKHSEAASVEKNDEEAGDDGEESE